MVKAVLKATQALSHLIFIATPGGKLLFALFYEWSIGVVVIELPVLWEVTGQAFTLTHMRAWQEKTIALKSRFTFTL